MYIQVFVLISRYKVLLYIGAVDGIIGTFIDISKVNKWSTDDMNLRLQDIRYNG